MTSEEPRAVRVATLVYLLWIAVLGIDALIRTYPRLAALLGAP